jgi:hypothetical protein
MAVESDQTRMSAGSPEESGTSAGEGSAADVVDGDQEALPRSNVASGIREAMAAIDAGRVDIARQRLAGILTQLR